MRFFTILREACSDLTAITQLPALTAGRRGRQGPEGPRGGRSKAKRLDGAEDGGTIERVMAVQRAAGDTRYGA